MPRDGDEYAHELYRMLRDADARGLDVVLAVVPDPTASARRSPTACDAPSGAPMSDRPIGVFDSGLGGLTVLRALIDLLPDERIVYFGDTGRFPYGPKPADEVLKYALEITDVLLERDVKLLVVACNSAAAAALDTLQAKLDIPVIGVIEPGTARRRARDADRPRRGDRHRGTGRGRQMVVTRPWVARVTPLPKASEPSSIATVRSIIGQRWVRIRRCAAASRAASPACFADRWIGAGMLSWR